MIKKINNFAQKIKDVWLLIGNPKDEQIRHGYIRDLNLKHSKDLPDWKSNAGWAAKMISFSKHWMSTITLLSVSSFIIAIVALYNSWH